MAYTGPFPHNNTGSVSAIIVSGTSFSGNVGNTGKVAPGDTTGTGIRVENDSTINGAISNAGTIAVPGDGIAVAGTASAIDNSDVVKGIVNAGAGTITASANGILVEDETKFAGGISNAGMISAGAVGILVGYVSTFAGGIGNSGTINGPFGILAFDVSASLSGGVSDSGKIELLYDGIVLLGETTFTGNITNTGMITATSGSGIDVSGVDFSGTASFNGNIGNSGAILASAYGIEIENAGVSYFSGGISNSGRITATTGDGIDLFKLGENGNFTGNIGNSGPVASTDDKGVVITDVAATTTGTFAGTIANSGAISAQKTDLDIGNVGTSRFSGGITNSGAVISAEDVGIAIGGVAAGGTFAGNIANSAAIWRRRPALTSLRWAVRAFPATSPTAAPSRPRTGLMASG